MLAVLHVFVLVKYWFAWPHFYTATIMIAAKGVHVS